ncbi:MAG TPA: YhdP family protein, partial [Rhodocyclaceae bacterium]|nr:YhdP family protein [Rhodocyclaceae bacterium]
RFDVKAYTQLSAYLPLPIALREQLALIAPQGRLIDFQLEWKGLPAALAATVTASPAPATPVQWSLRSRFEALSWNAFELMPGVNGVDGFIDGNQDRGSVQLGGQRAWVDLPKVFADPRVALDAFQADLGWKIDGDSVRIDIEKANFNNADGNGEAHGFWRSRGQRPGEIDLSARLARGNATAVWRYIPLQVGAQVREWLRTGLLGGYATDVMVTLKGDLDKFPFRGGQGGRDERGGLFEVRGTIHDATLHYADRWPGIAQIEGELLFSGERMLITGRRGKIGEIDLREVTAEIADLEHKEELLVVKGKAGGNTAHFLKFIAASPVDAWIDHSTAEMRADGPGELDLKLTLPLQRIETTRIEGSYRFDGAQVKVDADLPPLTEVRGPLRFTGDSLDARGLRAQLLGSPLTVDIKSAGNLQVNAQGEISIANLAREFPHPLFAHLSGVTPWQATIRGKKESAEVRVVSNLLGVSSSLPAPFNKSAIETMAFGFERKAAPPPIGARAKVGADETARRDLIDLSLGKARLQAVRRHDPAAAWPTLERGFLTLGEMPAPPLPERSLAIAIDQPRLNVDFWRELLQSDAPPRPAAPNAAIATLPPLAIELRCADLTVFDKSFHDVRLAIQRNDALLSRIDLKSRELTGRFDWNGSGAGKLSGRIAQFALPDSAVSNFDADALQAKADQVIDSLPALDIAIDKLAYKDRTLGTVGVAAENRDGFWHTKIDIKNEDGALTVNGRWKPSPTRAAIQPTIQSTIQPNTRLDFSLDSRSIDRLLVRFGYPNTVKRGAVNLSGTVSWNGPPFVVDYPSMSGQMKLDAVNGQFNKLEPGVGRLLGILSLQSLPRRITLDFRDIFSEGLAFDTISGQFDIAHGMMHTKNLQIQGPSARITMDGAIDLGEETQQLKVRVQPTIGESFAVGTAMLASPIAGAVAWVAQKMLKDPLDQAFSFEYAVSGGWNDPKVEKLKGAPRAVKPTETTP